MTIFYFWSIFSGEIVPVGPTSFEFKIPEGAPLTISPSVGTIEPGKVSCCQLTKETLELSSIYRIGNWELS